MLVLSAEWTGLESDDCAAAPSVVVVTDIPVCLAVVVTFPGVFLSAVSSGPVSAVD